MKKYLLTDKLYFKSFLALLIGILSSEYLDITVALCIPIGIFISNLLLQKYFSIIRSKWADFTVVMLLMYVGIFNHYFNHIDRVSKVEHKIEYISKSDNIHIIRIDEKPIFKKNSQKLEAMLLKSKVNDSIIEINEKILLYIPKEYQWEDSSMKYGGIYQIQSYISTPRTAQYDFEFDYKTWLYRHNIYATGYTRDMIKLGQDSSWVYKLKVLPLKLRDYFENEIDKFIKDEQSNDIAKSILIGVRTDVEKELLNAYADTGTIHILSISGLHFGILIIFIGFLLKNFVRNKKLFFLIKHFISLVYALITGFSPPIFRSFLMFLALDLEKFSKVKTSIINVLFLSAFVILLINTNQLFDIGFQLSYIALLGIILWVERSFWKIEFDNKVPIYLWKSTCTLLAAWVFTMPFTLFYFHKVAFLGMISNYVVIPIILVIMYTGFGLMALSFFDLIGNVVGEVLSLLISLQNKTIVFFSHIPYASFQNIYISKWVLGSILVSLLFLNLFLFMRSRVHFRYFIFFATITMLLYMYEYKARVNTNQWFYTSSYKYSTSIHYIDNKLIVYSDSIESSTLDFFINPIKMKQGVAVENILYKNSMSYEKNSLYSLQKLAKPRYMMLGKENKNEWYSIIRERDSFIIMNNLGNFYRARVIDSLKYYNRYYR